MNCAGAVHRARELVLAALERALAGDLPPQRIDQLVGDLGHDLVAALAGGEQLPTQTAQLA